MTWQWTQRTGGRQLEDRDILVLSEIIKSQSGRSVITRRPCRRRMWGKKYTKKYAQKIHTKKLLFPQTYLSPGLMLSLHKKPRVPTLSVAAMAACVTLI